MAELLDLPRSRRRTSDRAAQVDAFVDPALHRNRVAWDELDVPPRVRDLAEDVVGAAPSAAAPGGDAARPMRRSTRRATTSTRSTREAEAIAQSSITAAQAPAAAEGGEARGAAAVAARPRSPGASPRRYRRRARRALAALRGDRAPRIETCRASASSSRSTTSRTTSRDVPRLAGRADVRRTSRSSWSTTARPTAAPDRAALRRARPALPARPARPTAASARRATPASSTATGEFLAFVDCDDIVAAERLRAAAWARSTSTGSDFASGNVHRLTPPGRARSASSRSRSRETRLKTHITRPRRCSPTAPRGTSCGGARSGTSTACASPRAASYEDIPVDRPGALRRALGRRASPTPSTCWRIARGRGRSRSPSAATDPQALIDRLAGDPGRQPSTSPRDGPRKAKRWYDASVVADDLSYFLNVARRRRRRLPRATSSSASTRSCAGSSPRVFQPLPAIDRLKWHFVQRGMLPELLEVRRFEQEEMDDSLPVKIGGHWYLDHPFRTDRRLRIRRSLFRVDRDLDFTPWIDNLRWEDGGLRIEGGGSVAGIGAPRPDSQRVTVVALQPGRLQQVRQRVAGVRVRARNVQPDEQAHRGDGLADATWAGFVATLAPGRLRSLGRWQDGTWDVYVAVKVGKVRRYRSRFHVDSARPLRAAHHLVPRRAPDRGRALAARSDRARGPQPLGERQRPPSRRRRDRAARRARRRGGGGPRAGARSPRRPSPLPAGRHRRATARALHRTRAAGRRARGRARGRLGALDRRRTA